MDTPDAPSQPDAAPESLDARRWFRIAERGSLLGIRFTAWCYRVLGRRICLALVYAIVTYFFLSDAPGRRASRAYLNRVWQHPEGRASLRRRPGLRDCFDHYQAFGVSIVDRIAIWSGRGSDFDFEVHGVELVDRLAEEGRGALVLGAHLGSFDALRLLAERVETKVNVLMFTEHAQHINRVFQELSPDAGARVIAADPRSVQSVFEIRACLARGEVVAILGDRVEAGDRGRSSPVPLLGGVVELPQAPFLLAQLLGCSVFLMLALRVNDDRYEVFTEKLSGPQKLPRAERDKRVHELVAAYAERLEHHCLKTPYQWFNFYDYWGDADAPRSGA
jgi:predicted LPLAT superfamily acyltransferase